MWKKLDQKPKAKETMSKFEVLGAMKMFEDTQFEEGIPDEYIWKMDDNEIRVYDGYTAISGEWKSSCGSDWYEIFGADTYIYLDHLVISENGENLVCMARNYTESTEENPDEYFIEYYELIQ